MQLGCLSIFDCSHTIRDISIALKNEENTMTYVRITITVLLLVIASRLPAATLLKKQNFTWSVNGDLQIQFRRATDTNEDVTIDFDDAEFKNEIVYDLGANVSVFGQMDIELSKGADVQATDVAGNSIDGETEAVGIEEIYVGIAADRLKFWFG